MGAERSRLVWLRRSALVVGSIVAILILGFVAIGRSTPEAGPWEASSSTTVEFPLPPGQPATWGSMLPPNLTGSDITIQSIDPVGVDGLKVLGTLASDAGVDGSLVNALGFPPAGISTFPPKGAIQPAGPTTTQLQVLVGISQPGGRDKGTINGLRVRYEIDGKVYETEFPYKLGITAAP